MTSPVQDSRYRRVIWQSMLFASAGVFIWHLPVMANLPVLIRNDTLLTLAVSHAVMLVLLTTSMSGFLVVCITLKSCAMQSYSRDSGASGKVLIAMLDLLSTLIVLWSALALVPQVFYQFYRFVFKGLPSQWVINPVPFSDFYRLWIATNSSSLSELAASLVLWVSLMSGFMAWVTSGQADWHKV